MHFIIEHSALVAAAAWLSLDFFFVIAWARLHRTERHSQPQTQATVIEFRANRRSQRDRASRQKGKQTEGSPLALPLLAGHKG